MKIFTKICLIISGVCICIAAICLGIGVALGSGVKEVRQMADNGELDLGNWHIGGDGIYWKDDDFTEVEIKEGSVSESFMASQVNSLDIDIKYGEVYFIDSDSDEITIHIDAPKRNKYECENDNGTLKLKDKTSSYRWSLGKKNEVTVTIAIPKGKEFEEVDLITNAGTLEITHGFLAEEIDIELDAGELTGEHLEAKKEFSINVGAGNLEITDMKSGNLDVDCGVGKVNLAGTVSENVKADCGVGEITMSLNGREEDYDYEISCGVGEVSVNGTTYSSLSTDEKINNHAGNKITLDCGVGEIDVMVEEN